MTFPTTTQWTHPSLKKRFPTSEVLLQICDKKLNCLVLIEPTQLILAPWYFVRYLGNWQDSKEDIFTWNNICSECIFFFPKPWHKAYLYREPQCKKPLRQSRGWVGVRGAGEGAVSLITRCQRWLPDSKVTWGCYSRAKQLKTWLCLFLRRGMHKRPVTLDGIAGCSPRQVMCQDPCWQPPVERGPLLCLTN